MEYVNGISKEELIEHVKTLSSAKFEGRGTGLKGQHLASQYLKEQFIDMDLVGPSPSGDPYYQEFKLIPGISQNLEFIVGNDTISTKSHLALVGYIPPCRGKYELTFVAFGIDHENYSDYTDIDVQGKIVAFLAGEPIDKHGKYLISDSYLPYYGDRGKKKAEIAFSKGAVAAIRINPDQDQVDKTIRMLKRYRDSGTLSLVESNPGKKKIRDVIHVGIEDAAKLFALKQRVFEKAINKQIRRKKSFESLHSLVLMQSSVGDDLVETENVVAFLEGNEMKDEIVIITAHFDHLGIRGDNINYGADDNASGTAAVIEIAEAFAELAKDGIRPKRSILFMPVSGEERGLLGSKFYVNNPLFPINRTVAAINMDMIGRSDNQHKDNPNYVYLYMSDSASGSLAECANIAALYVQNELSPEYQYLSDYNFRMGGSDHASFQDVNVPVLYFYCGIHEDYHKPTDTWDKVDYDKLSAISRMVFVSAWEIANK